jgi:hypothetical protein
MAIVKPKLIAPWLLNTGILIATLPVVVYPIAALFLMALAEKYFGIGARIGVGLFSLGGFIIYLRYLWRWVDWFLDRERDHKREKYRGIYRVKALPKIEKSIWRNLGAEIKVGDYGWEASPWRQDGMIYLQGLNEKWGLVWWAGFEADQIEYVCPKPVSQYDWRDFDYEGPKPKALYHWKYSKPKVLCQFPVETPPNNQDGYEFPV